MNKLKRNIKEIKCPFFHGEDTFGRRMSCEGFIGGTTATITTFETQEALRRHKQTYCNKFKYKECPLAETITRKYDEV